MDHDDRSDAAALPRLAHSSALPATGAWRPGDEPGRRRFLRLGADRPYVLEGGGRIDGGIDLAYETFGTPAPDGSNAVLVCHALTGDSHVTGPAGPGHPAPGWWPGTVGPGRTIDTDRWFVVCANVVGGCQGSTGPASPHPDDGRPWGSRFPVVSARDQVRAQAALANELGIDRWAAVVGGSMGGMVALEWAVMFPERVGSVVVVASCAAASAQQIAWWSTQRRIIAMDPAWHGGDYYDAGDGEGPHHGLAVARMVSQITFRSDDVFNDRFGREVVEPLDGGFAMWQRFQVERYLDYHGDKLVRRFDANTYLLLTKLMDLHDVGRGRGGLGGALSRLEGPLLAVGIDSDSLYPAYQSRELVDAARSCGVNATYAELHSPHGHDAFLIESDALDAHLRPFLERAAPTAATPTPETTP